MQLLLESITTRQITLETLTTLFTCDIKVQNVILNEIQLWLAQLCVYRCLYRDINKPQTIAIRSWSANYT